MPARTLVQEEPDDLGRDLVEGALARLQWRQQGVALARRLGELTSHKRQEGQVGCRQPDYPQPGERRP